MRESKLGCSMAQLGVLLQIADGAFYDNPNALRGQRLRTLWSCEKAGWIGADGELTPAGKKIVLEAS